MVKKIVNGVKVPHDKSIKDLKLMLMKDMPHFFVACEALTLKGTLESLDILKEQLSSSDWSKRRAATEAIGNHAQGKLISKQLISLLSDKSEYVRRTVIKVLAKLNIEESHDNLVVLLNSRDDDTREEIVSALYYLWNEKDFNLMISLYLGDKSKGVKDKAALILSERSTKNNWKSAYEILKIGFLPRHRVWACELIEKYGDKSDINDLKLMSEDNDGHVRKKAIRILQKLSKDI